MYNGISHLSKVGYFVIYLCNYVYVSFLDTFRPFYFFTLVIHNAQQYK